MGYSLAWLAIKNKSPVAVREGLGYRGTGEYEPIPESALTAAVLPGGWYLVVNNDDDHVATDSVLQKLTDGCEAVACFVEEHVMFSQAAGWQNGEQIWTVTHASEHGREHLETQGKLPANFSSIRDELLSQQRTADGDDIQVDYIFDIPVALAESLTGFRHDGEVPELGGQGFEVLECKDDAGRQKSWFARFFGKSSKS